MSRPLCPRCSARLSHVLHYAGEYVPPGAVTQNVTPLHVAAIDVTCANGHRFTASEHGVEVKDGEVDETYRGLTPVAERTAHDAAHGGENAAQ